jgi:hypothetical protein
MCKEKNFCDAEALITRAIDMIEQNCIEAPYVYIERARIRIILNKNTEALEDLNYILTCKNVNLSDKSNMLILRHIACNACGIFEDAQNSWEEYKACNVMPEYDETDEYLVIRNMPNCSCYRKLIVGYHLEMGICKNLSDIKMIDENTCIINKTIGISVFEGWKEDNLITIKVLGGDHPAEDDCEGWCDYMAIVGDGWCGATFKTPPCIAACCMAVEFIKKKLCYRCCTNGEFYRNCIEPFARILDYIKEPCDPMWD